VSGIIIAVVIFILFAATLVRSTLGFGEALIAVPLLALFMPVTVAAPLAVLVSITIAFLILLRDWRSVHVRGAGMLITSTLFGIPIGLWVLTRAPERVVKVVLGVVIVAFALHRVVLTRRYVLRSDRGAWVFGFLAGVLGGAYGMNGPPLAIYGALRQWRPEEFRATLQAYFLVASIVGMAGYGFAGLWTAEVNHLFVVSLPGVVLATLAGRWLHARVPADRFATWVYVGLFCTGAMLLVQAFATGS
jgi:uncharacterized membrane protein YfcA